MARPAVKTGLSVGQALISGGEFGSVLAKRSSFLMELFNFSYPFSSTFVQLTKNNVVTARANSMSCADSGSGSSEARYF